MDWVVFITFWNAMDRYGIGDHSNMLGCHMDGVADQRIMFRCHMDDAGGNSNMV